MNTRTWRYPKRLSLARVPTPLQPLHFFRIGAGAQVYVKRDDLTGTATTGNKIRKLEFLLADALRLSCDAVITCGGAQSNHARSTAVAAAMVGMKSVLFLRGQPDTLNEANLMLDRVVGAEIHFISADEYTRQRNRIMEDYAKHLSLQGRKAYVIPEGGSDAVGTWGYIRAVDETYRQVRKMGLRVGGVVAAVGSGGTHSGLLLGTLLINWNVPVWGINICDDRKYFEEKIEKEICETIEKYHLKVKFKPSDIHIIDGYVGEGYGIASPEVHELICQLASETGIILDPVYSAKAFYGMMQEINKGCFGKHPALVFFHTGGIFGLLARKLADFH